MARRRRVSAAARDCISEEIAKHCHKKFDRCSGKRARRQAIAIGYSICRRRGFKVPKL